MEEIQIIRTKNPAIINFLKKKEEEKHAKHLEFVKRFDKSKLVAVKK